MRDGRYARTLFLTIRRVEIDTMKQLYGDMMIVVDPGDQIICDGCNGEILDDEVIILDSNAHCDDCRKRYRA